MRKLDSDTMIDFLLAPYEGDKEYAEQEARLEALTDTQLKEEYEETMEKMYSEPDLYIDFSCINVYFNNVALSYKTDISPCCSLRRNVTYTCTS